MTSAGSSGARAQHKQRKRVLDESETARVYREFTPIGETGLVRCSRSTSRGKRTRASANVASRVSEEHCATEVADIPRSRKKRLRRGTEFRARPAPAQRVRIRVEHERQEFAVFSCQATRLANAPTRIRRNPDDAMLHLRFGGFLFPYNRSAAAEQIGLARPWDGYPMFLPDGTEVR